MLPHLRARARALKVEAHALYLACRDPRVPWHVKALAACVAGYALSPIDLIPDFVPLLGYLDDLVLIPIGVLAVRRLIPSRVMEECRARALREGERPVSRTAARIIVLLWILGLGAAVVGISWVVLR